MTKEQKDSLTLALRYAPENSYRAAELMNYIESLEKRIELLEAKVKQLPSPTEGRDKILRGPVVHEVGPQPTKTFRQIDTRKNQPKGL